MTSNVTITIDIGKKTVSVDAAMTIREDVFITLVNVGASSVLDVILKIIDDENAELAACSSFVDNAGTFEGTLSLNSTLLGSAFDGDGPMVSHRFHLQVFSIETDNESLLINDYILIGNNPLTSSVQNQVITEI